MKKLRTKLGLLVLMAMLGAGIAAMPVGAAPSFSYTPVEGDKADGTDDVTFNKYLVVNNGSAVPDVTFDFSIAPGTGVGSTVDTIAVYPGPVNSAGTKPSVESAVFGSGDTASTTKTTDDTVILAADEAFVKKAVTIDFDGVQFTEPGVYRYIITENIGNAMGFSYDTQVVDDTMKGQRTLDVYVTDDGTGSLVVTGYVLHEGTSAPAKGENYGSSGTTLSDKSDGFVNSHEAYDLVFSKTVTGNQASRDKYFEFTVTISSAVSGTIYTVSYEDDHDDATADGNADKSISANPNAATTKIANDVAQPTDLTVGDNGMVTQKFYLQDGQSIAIRGLAKGTQYSIFEDEEDYKASSTTTDSAAAEKGGNTVRNNTGISQDVSAAFTNTRNGVIPTGVIMSVAPWVIAGIVIIGGIIFFVVRSKKKYDEE